ncbi:MAG: hypothetical protein JWO89_2801, partial [Verrucomicrobiaceae bacterium]|nr:hypothetical protein [Verrucomicrobiaceae bacterium]
MLQRLTFKNTTGWRLDGLRLSLARLPAGISLYSSSDGTTPGTLEVLYTAPIAPAGGPVIFSLPAQGEPQRGPLISFDLVYFDPYRRSAASIQPMITVSPLDETVTNPGP